MEMWIEEIWRYPVKSMKGESLKEAHLSAEGIEGDRTALIVRGGRIITSRTHPRLLAHQGGLDAEGEPLVDGRPWNDDAVFRMVEEIAGEGARIVRYNGAERFDILPLLIATDGAIAALGIDHRRLRPNIVIGGVDGLAERSWEGKFIRAGRALIFARDLRGRCVMTTFDPDTQTQDPGVLRRIVRDFGGTFCLNAGVAEGGPIAVGDRVEIIETSAG